MKNKNSIGQNITERVYVGVIIKMIADELEIHPEELVLSNQDKQGKVTLTALIVGMIVAYTLMFGLLIPVVKK